MKRSEHAQQIADRFRDMLKEAGDSLSAEHYDELTLLIEAGIDTALVEKLESIADKVDKVAHSIRVDAETFT